MDNAYRFGQVTVGCEGYEYPDDPFVLRGSCGVILKTQRCAVYSVRNPKFDLCFLSWSILLN